MLTTRNLLYWLLLATLPCLGLRCDRYCDGCEPQCNGQYAGGLSLRPGSAQWLPAAPPDSLHFINSNGYRAVLDLVRPPLPDSVSLPAYTTTDQPYNEGQLNPTYAFCGAYFRARRVALQYQGRNLNIDLQYNLFKDLSTNSSMPNGSAQLTQAAADTLPDIVTLTFNQQFYAGFPVVSTPYRQPRTISNGQVVYLDSVQLAGRKFFGVYQFSLAPFSTGLQPQRFFFQPGQGLVGFTYTNDEQWARL